VKKELRTGTYFNKSKLNLTFKRSVNNNIIIYFWTGYMRLWFLTKSFVRLYVCLSRNWSQLLTVCEQSLYKIGKIQPQS